MRAICSLGIGLIYAAYTIVRISAELSAAKRRTVAPTGAAAFERRKDARELAALTVLEFFLLALYFFRSPAVERFAVPAPDALRLAGLAVGLSGVALIAWASAVLDGEYSSVVEFKDGHRLITAGPYARIRHPIYAGLSLLNLGVAAAAANALIALVWVGGLALVLVRRIPREERELEARFGAQWQAYRERVGRFLPRFSPGYRRSGSSRAEEGGE